MLPPRWQADAGSEGRAAVPTTRTTGFPTGEGEMRFDKARNIVDWDTGQNRNAIDRARASVAGAALFSRLKRARWTPNTNGVFMGNN